MKKHFMTGLALLLPAAVTLIVVIFLINFLTMPFVGLLQHMIRKYTTLDQPLFFFSAEEMVFFFSKIIVLLFLCLLILGIGYIGSWFVVRYFFRLSDYILQRIPLINKIYTSLQEVTKTIFHAESSSFSQVVLVPFPHGRTKSIGLVSSEQMLQSSDESYRQLVSVFVPGTPNPTVGFMLMYRRDQLTYLDMTVEEAFKLIVSCGMKDHQFVKKSFELSELPQDISGV